MLNNRLLQRSASATVLLLLSSVFWQAFAIEIIGRQQSVYDVRAFKLSFATGMASLAAEEGLDSDGVDLGYRLTVAKALTRRLHLEAIYQLNSLALRSQSPLGLGQVRHKFFLNNEIIRLVYRLDRWPLIPYVAGGVGLYHTSSINSQTGLDFPIGMQMPLALGVELYPGTKNWSLAAEYSYQILFDEEQSAGVLALIGANRVSFDVQSIWLQIHWHLF